MIMYALLMLLAIINYLGACAWPVAPPQYLQEASLGSQELQGRVSEQAQQRASSMSNTLKRC